VAADSSLFRRLIDSPYAFWALLSLPAIPMLASIANRNFQRLLHPTGEFSARFMIVAMMLTPLAMLFPKARLVRWLLRRRRYLGVAAFGYAALHVIAYVAYKSPELIADEFFEPALLTGWIAFAIFVPLALSSNDAALRALGRKWKPLQRWVYGAALLTVAHWYLLKYNLGPALVHFLPLAGLEAYRVWRNFAPKRIAA
jgi:methionine sulfoxide reductase heme-binding subunit